MDNRKPPKVIQELGKELFLYLFNHPELPQQEKYSLTEEWDLAIKEKDIGQILVRIENLRNKLNG